MFYMVLLPIAGFLVSLPLILIKMVTLFLLIPPSTECIAVSKAPDPTGAYFVYAFQIPSGLIGDFPKLAVWPDAYYMTTNDFGGPNLDFIGVGIFAFDRSKMLVGDPAASIIFVDLSQNPSTSNLFQMLPSNVQGQSPPFGTPNFVAGLVAPEITGDSPME